MSSLRTLVVLEPPIKKIVGEISRTEGISVSAVCRDLIREALEIYEDRYWNQMAKERDKGFNWNKALTHEQAWKNRKKAK